jgi:predicted cupin superfamily sugar epimerase
MHPDTKAIIEHYQFDRLPVEGTFFKSTYRSTLENADGSPVGTAMIGLYCAEPLSVSCFHRLRYDEIWHVYGGDPFRLILLHPDGRSEEVVMGSDALRGQRVQFVVPAGVWQAGEIISGGRYALFGCTMAPGFTGAGFEGGIAADLIRQYPDRADDILRLSVNGDESRMPEGFAE